MTQKGQIRTWSNSRGEGKLFSIEMVDESVSAGLARWRLPLERPRRPFWERGASLAGRLLAGPAAVPSTPGRQHFSRGALGLFSWAEAFNRAWEEEGLVAWQLPSCFPLAVRKARLPLMSLPLGQAFSYKFRFSFNLGPPLQWRSPDPFRLCGPTGAVRTSACVHAAPFAQVVGMLTRCLCKWGVCTQARAGAPLLWPGSKWLKAQERAWRLGSPAPQGVWVSGIGQRKRWGREGLWASSLPEGGS